MGRIVRMVEADDAGRIIVTREIEWPTDPGDDVAEAAVAELEAAARGQGRRLYRLRADERPTFDGHRVNPSTGRVRQATPAERAEAAGGNAPR